MLERVWRKGTLLHCWWECKLVQTLWRTVWRFLKKLEVELPSVQSLRRVWLFPTPWNTACQASLSPSPRVHSNSGLLSRWCHPAISSSVVPFSSCPQSIPGSVFFNESTLCRKWPKYCSFSFSIIPSEEHSGLISLQWTGWISLQAKGLSRVFSNNTVQNHQFFGAQLSSQSNSQSIHDHWKKHSLV